MNPAVAIALISALSQAIDVTFKAIQERRRNRELTEAEEKEWDAYVVSRLSMPHWQPSTERTPNV